MRDADKAIDVYLHAPTRTYGKMRHRYGPQLLPSWWDIEMFNRQHAIDWPACVVCIDLKSNMPIFQHAIHHHWVQLISTALSCVNLFAYTKQQLSSVIRIVDAVGVIYSQSDEEIDITYSQVACM
jgi:hypothetical protein